MESTLRPRGAAGISTRISSCRHFKSRRRAKVFWLASALLLMAATCALVVPLKVFGSAEPGAGTVFARLAWGDGDGQVGLVTAKEGLTRGPEALAVAPDGRVAILDSVNHRLVLLDADGRPLGQIAVDLEQPRFLAVDDEALYVLDADSDKKLATYSWAGVLLSVVDAPESNDAVTGLFSTSEGPCVEAGHRRSLLMGEGTQAQTAGERPADSQGWARAMPGRPMDKELATVVCATFSYDDGFRLRTQSLDRANMQLGEPVEASPSLAAGQAVEHLVSVDSDGHGGLLVGARLLKPMTQGKLTSALAITRLSSAGQGQTNGKSQSAQVADGEVLLLDECEFAYLGDPYRVAPDGRVFQPIADESGYTILVHSFGEVQP